MRDLHVPLRLALYGHPDAGDAKLGEKGFSPVHGWPGCYSHSSLAVFLTVYVDDFKMSGREADVTKAWRLIKEVIQLEEPTPTGRYLGCQHQESMGDVVPRLSPSAELPGVTPSKEAKHRVRVLTYDMSSFVEQCVSSYLELAGRDRGSLHEVPTPFLDESNAWEPPEGAPTGALAHVALKS